MLGEQYRAIVKSTELRHPSQLKSTDLRPTTIYRVWLKSIDFRLNDTLSGVAQIDRFINALYIIVEQIDRFVHYD